MVNFILAHQLRGAFDQGVRLHGLNVRGHEASHQGLRIMLLDQIRRGHDAEQFASLADHRQSMNAVLLHEVLSLACRLSGSDGGDA